MDGDATEVPASGPHGVAAWLVCERWRAPVLVLLLGCVLTAAYGTPREASDSRLAAAIRTGDVRAIMWDDRSSYGLEMSGRGQTTTSYGDRQWVLWMDSSRVLHRTWVPWAVGDAGAAPVDLDATIRATARAAETPAPALDGAGFRPWSMLGWPLLAMELLSVLLLVLGPQPRRKTKWATFWTLGLPAGAGVAWWILRDSPWSHAANVIPEPVPRARGAMPSGQRRMGGAVAFFAVLVVGGSLVMGLIHVVASAGAQDAGPSGSRGWSVVRVDGTTTTAPG